MISHIESYNLKNASHGIVSSSPTISGFAGDAVHLKSPQHHYRLINDLQKALNDDNVIALKRVVRAIIFDYDEDILGLQKQLELQSTSKHGLNSLEMGYRCMLERKTELTDILFHLETFHNYYKRKTLGSRIGSGSTGQAEHQHGMSPKSGTRRPGPEAPHAHSCNRPDDQQLTLPEPGAPGRVTTWEIIREVWPARRSSSALG